MLDATHFGLCPAALVGLEVAQTRAGTRGVGLAGAIEQGWVSWHFRDSLKVGETAVVYYFALEKLGR